MYENCGKVVEISWKSFEIVSAKTRWEPRKSGFCQSGSEPPRTHPVRTTWPSTPNRTDEFLRLEPPIPPSRRRPAPSPLFFFFTTTTVPLLQPLHTPHFLDTPSPNCSHYWRLMSGEARASRCPRGPRGSGRGCLFFFSLSLSGSLPPSP